MGARASAAQRVRARAAGLTAAGRSHLGTAERRLGDQTRGVRDARHGRFGVKAVEVGEGEDGLGADDDSEHTFANPGDEPAIILNTFTPDLYVGYFRDLSKLAGSGEMTPEAILAVMARYATYPAGRLAPGAPEVTR